jgi:hypothetical protein
MEAHTEPEQQHAAGSQASDRIHVVIDAFRYLQTYRVTTNIMFNHMDVKILDEGHVTQRNKAIWDVTIRQWNCNAVACAVASRASASLEFGCAQKLVEYIIFMKAAPTVSISIM